MGKGKRNKPRKTKFIISKNDEQSTSYNLYILAIIVCSSIVGWLLFVS